MNFLLCFTIVKQVCSSFFFFYQQQSGIHWQGFMQSHPLLLLLFWPHYADGGWALCLSCLRNYNNHKLCTYVTVLWCSARGSPLLLTSLTFLSLMTLIPVTRNFLQGPSIYLLWWKRADNMQCDTHLVRGKLILQQNYEIQTAEMQRFRHWNAEEVALLGTTAIINQSGGPDVTICLGLFKVSAREARL